MKARTTADRLRTICLDLPEAAEKETWGHPTFRVRDKIFASFGQNDAGESVATMKAPRGEQEILLAASDDFFYPAYVGTKGWIGIRLHSRTDWSEIEELVEDSYRLIAPKRLSKLLNEAGANDSGRQL